MKRRCITSPLGPLTLTEENGAITTLRWETGPTEDSPLLKKAEDQLAAYFAGSLRDFTLPLQVKVSQFQQEVCSAISAIPYGETRSYGHLAQLLNAPPQAVGQGCGGNPIPILIPCHRVTGSNRLGGFSGGTGTETKVWLLRHEGGLLL